jgi:glycosyltransferase involved in cell wall biosynthesis
MYKNKLSILYVGSDLSPPFTTMEAKMVGILNCEFKDNYRIKSISINVSKDKIKQNGIIAVNGSQKGPILVRKIIYGVDLLITYSKVLLLSKPDIIHFIWVGFDPLTSIMIKLAKWKEIKVVITVLNTHSPMSRYAWADRLVFHSIFSKNKLSITQPNIESAKVIPPPVRQKTFEKNEALYFVFASGPRTRAQITERGVYLLMDAMRILQDSNTAITLRFIGRWPEGAKLLDEIIKQRELRNVVISHHHVENMDNVIGEACGLIIPYVGETIGDVPLSALESLAFGVPVISTHEFHILKTDEEPALTICEQDSKKLADRMIAISQTGDVSHQCRDLVKQCGIDEFIQSHDELYQSL